MKKAAAYVLRTDRRALTLKYLLHFSPGTEALLSQKRLKS
jgi:hypothetical protein